MKGGDKGLMALEGFRDAKVTKSLVGKIEGLVARDLPGRKVRFMHVCGSHEHTMTYYGLRSLLPTNLELVSGPGCPVCVCATSDIREAIELSKGGNVLCTFGDMIRDRTPYGSLEEARSEGSDVRIIYSPQDAVKVAKENPKKEVVLFGVGFETTAAPVCSLLFEDAPENFSILTSLKRTSPAVEALLHQGEIALDGVIAPGHVSTVIGAGDWSNLADGFKIPTIVSGFEPVDVLISILRLLEQVRDGTHELQIEYQRLVSFEGNRVARQMLSDGFDVREAHWRAMGKVPGSGYFIKSRFETLDARKRHGVSVDIDPKKDTPPGCKCHLVVTGMAYPTDCALFNKGGCRPDSPIGPCMVSGEGTCYIWYRYGDARKLKRRASKRAGRR
jgi:hydrogenase expression/formation protein HypD